MDVTAASNQNAVPLLSPSETGFNALSSENFLEMMVVQLQNQDPLEPTGNEELLNQISQMRSLQSSIELSDVLKDLNSQQQLTSAASLIAQNVRGLVSTADGREQTIEGIVERAFVKEGRAFVGTSAGELPLDAVFAVG